MTWTRFMDMHSGGRNKVKGFEYIYIEAPHDEAVVIFYNRFGHSPNRVSCTCCGEDYGIQSGESLAQLTGYDRNCRSVMQHRNPKTKLWLPLPKGVNHYLEEGEKPPKGYEVDERYGSRGTYQTLAEYRKQKGVLFIEASMIRPEERMGDVPEQGYVWQD